MKFRILFLCAFALTICSEAQIRTNLGATMEIDTARNQNLKKVFMLWKNYLNSKPDSLYDNPYWNKQEKKIFKSYDLLKSEGFLSPSLYDLCNENNILSIESQGDAYKIRSVFYAFNSKFPPYIYAITYTMAIPDGNSYALANYLPYHTLTWFKRKVGRIEYCYHPNHPFDLEKAKKANEYLNFVEKQFNIKLAEKVMYFIAPNCDELQKLKGYDHVIGMGTGVGNCGFIDSHNNIVYVTSAGGEDHEHELTHMLNSSFPKAHYILLEGIATLQGGNHMGKPLSYHLQKTRDFLEINPKLDLTNIEKLSSYHIGEDTELMYVVAAIITQMILDKGGIELFKKALNSTAADDDEKLLTFLVNNLNIKRKELNKIIINKVNSYKK